MSFDDGFILGLSMGGNNDYKNRDPDFALYKAMEEPKANQIKVLVRVTDKGAGQELRYIIPCDRMDTPVVNINVVDWGDGTPTELFDATTGLLHTYGAAGDYIITVTDNAGDYDYYKCNHNEKSNQAYLIAIKVGTDIAYADGKSYDGTYYISSNFKYMQFGSGDVLSGSFRINSCLRLTEIDVLDATVRPISFPNNMFSSCNALDFRNIMPFLSELTEISDYSFSYCFGLKKLNLPKCTKVGIDAVKDCFSLTHVDLPECVEIGSNSLCGNDALREVNLPKCQTIGDSALSSNYILNKITVPDDCSISLTAMKSCRCLIPTPNGIYP